MPISRRFFAVAALGVLLTPAAVSADVIQCMDPANPACQVVGELTWSRDDFFGFGDILALNNLSAATTFAGTFSGISLTVSPEADPLNLFPSTTLDPVEFSMETSSLFDVESAVLTFMFQNASFTATLLASDLVFDEFFFTTMGSTLIFAQDVPAAVPEPSTLFLLVAGLAGARIARRSREGRSQGDKRPARD